MPADALNRTALYLRLSRDDEKAGESLSIENQRAILRQYASQNGGRIVGEYIDDGWSGTDFDRPAMQRLLHDAERGTFDTVLVKDLSRFGRNYICVGQYIDYIFPACGIRFIALADRVDTADRTSAGMDMMPILNVFNEWHAANTSKKIRAVLEADWKRGKYTNWAYPYGYRAGTDENRTAIVDEEAAKNVRRIFDLRLQGCSVRAIARTLTEEKVPNPTAHYTRLDGKRSERRCSPCWSPKTVAAILKDSTYIGTMTQHRTARFSYKNHAVVRIPAEEHFVKENAHQAIVDRETFAKVQAIGNGVSRGRADRTEQVHALSGLLFCADCGKKLKYKRGRRARGAGGGYYLCRTYADLGKKHCSSHALSERQIESLLLQDIRSMLGEMPLDERKEAERFRRRAADRGKQTEECGEKHIHALRGRLAELDKLIKAAFEDKVKGTLPECVCRDLCKQYRAERERAENMLRAAEERRSAETADSADAEEYIKHLRHALRFGRLTREICLQLVHFIVVGEKPADGGARQIHIYYHFSPPDLPPPENR